MMQNDFLEIFEEIAKLCLLESPTFESDFIYLNSLGQGSQARIDLYQSIDEP